MTGFVGGGAHWRVLRVDRFAHHVYPYWQIYRRHWDRWEPIDPPYLSQNGAMTRAHDLARLNRA